jgi:hypothetical protein
VLAAGWPLALVGAAAAALAVLAAAVGWPLAGLAPCGCAPVAAVGWPPETVVAAAAG